MAARVTPMILDEHDGAGLGRLERDLAAILAECPSGADTSGILIELTVNIDLIRKLHEALRVARLSGQAIQ